MGAGDRYAKVQVSALSMGRELEAETTKASVQSRTTKLDESEPDIPGAGIQLQSSRSPGKRLFPSEEQYFKTRVHEHFLEVRIYRLSDL